MKTSMLAAAALAALFTVPTAARTPAGDNSQAPATSQPGQEQAPQGDLPSCFGDGRSDIASNMGRNGWPHGQAIRNFTPSLHEDDLEWIAENCTQLP